MSQSFISLLAFALLRIGSVEAAPSIWDIHIDNDPAPPPDKGAPLSAGATRDPSKLKFELIAIFASYVFWILVTGFAIYLVRRRIRKAANQPNQSYKMDVLKFKPHMNTRQLSLDKQPLSPKYPENNSPKSPKSPGKMASIKSWTRGHRSVPSDATVQTIDSRVLENDKAKNMDEMTKLYAAVMAHDEERSQHQKSPSFGSDASPISQGNSPVSQFSFPEFQHLRNPTAPAPGDHSQHYAQTSQEHDSRYGPTPSSFVSAGTTRVDSADSYYSKQSRVSVRGRPISRPVAMADLEQSVAYGLPSSPRMFNPGPPPPVPGSPESMNKLRDFERRGAPTPLSLRSDAASSASNLPFRQMYTESLKSAPATKTTFLERKVKDQGPMTGVPYSPYTPFTPMTPITPRRLPTKQELKQSRKKGTLKALREDGMVMSDEDMWGNN